MDLGAGRAFLAHLLESSQGEEGDYGLALSMAVLWFFLGLQFKKQIILLCLREGRLNTVSLERTCDSGQTVICTCLDTHVVENQHF